MNKRDDLLDYIKNHKPSKWAQIFADNLNANVLKEDQERQSLKKQEQAKKVKRKSGQIHS